VSVDRRVLGFAALGEVELNLVIVVATTDVFRDHLDRVREAIDVGLLTPLEKLGPSRVRVAILGYGERTLGQKSVGTIAAARAALARLTVDEVTPEVALVAAIAEATTLATKTKPKAAGAMQRTAIVIVSDGDGIPAEPEARAKVTKVAEAAGKKNVRIHALGFSPSQARRPSSTWASCPSSRAGRSAGSRRSRASRSPPSSSSISSPGNTWSPRWSPRRSSRIRSWR
jgi:hypothetical protein